MASVDPEIDPRPSLSRFAEEVDGRGEVILVESSCDQYVADLTTTFRNVRVLGRTPGMLAPELWRDGLRAADSEFVGFSTTSMIPEPGWLDTMLDRLQMTEAAGVGGSIWPAAKLSPTDRAVYLLRYVNYYKPLISNPGPPGENAIYRRDRLEKFQDLIDRGFWEVDIHRALRHQGERLAIADNASVIYHGGAPLYSILRQRLRHAKIYGVSRGSRMTTIERALRTACFPMIPALMFHRIVSAMRSNFIGVRSWVPAWPGLFLLSTVWAIGEALGYWMKIDSASTLTSSKSTSEREEWVSASRLETWNS